MIVYCSIGDTSLRDFYIMTLPLNIKEINAPSSMPNRVEHGKKQQDESLTTYSRSQRSKEADRSKLEIRTIYFEL